MKNFSKLLLILGTSALLSTGCATNNWTTVPPREEFVQQPEVKPGEYPPEKKKEQGYFLFGSLFTGVWIPYDN
jgi:hypothetical protein